MAGKGGGADKAVRLMQGIISKNNLAPVPVIPVNKPGGSGADALVYMKGKTGDNHTLMFTLNFILHHTVTSAKTWHQYRNVHTCDADGGRYVLSLG